MNTANVHIPDGFLDIKTCAGTLCAAGAGLAIAVRKVQAECTDKTVPLMGVMSAFVFAGQMINFPVAPGTSGHLMGGTLAAIFLGPSAAVVVMATVLLVQCFLFQDGGVTSFGANVFNLGLAGVLSGYVVFRLLSARWTGHRGFIGSAAIASWVSVMTAALFCSIELAASGVARWTALAGPLLIAHVMIGIAEAAITAAVASFVVRVRPDLQYNPVRLPVSGLAAEPMRPYLCAAFFFSVGTAIWLSPFASSLPDGLEWVFERLAVDRPAVTATLLPDWIINALKTEWLAGSIGAGCGTILTFAIAYGVGRRLRPPRAN